MGVCAYLEFGPPLPDSEGVRNSGSQDKIAATVRYVTNLITANVETLRHDDCKSHTAAFLQKVMSLRGGMTPCPPLDLPLQKWQQQKRINHLVMD